MDITEGVVSLIKQLGRLDNYKIYNLGSNCLVKITTFIDALEAVIGKKAKINLLLMQSGDVVFTCANISEDKQDFNYCSSVGIEEGLRRFVEWYRDYYDVDY